MTKYIITTALCTLGGLLIGYLYAKHAPAAKFTQEDAVSISRTGSFELDRTPENALPLFTAPGEKLWISVWDPTILKGDGFEKGTVFVTSNHGNTTYWTVMDYNIKTHHALYSRVTPGSDMGTVGVSLQPNGKGGSIVNVSYALTALSQAGNKQLQESFSEEKYAQMMEEWRTMINDSKETIDKHFSNSSHENGGRQGALEPKKETNNRPTNQAAVLTIWAAAEKLEATALFYKDVLGLRPANGSGSNIFDADGTFLIVMEGEFEQPRNSKRRWPMFALTVPDLDKSVKALKDAGIELPWGIEEFGTPKPSSRYVMFYDPAGNLIEIVEWL